MIVVKNTLIILTKNITRDSIELINMKEIFNIVAPYVESIESNVFRDCNSIRYVYCPQLLNIEDEAFIYCRAL